MGESANSDGDREALRLERAIAERDEHLHALEGLVAPLETAVSDIQGQFIHFIMEQTQLLKEVRERHWDLRNCFEGSKNGMRGVEEMVGTLGYELADLRSEFTRSNSELQRKLWAQSQEQAHGEQHLLAMSKEWLREKTDLEQDLAESQERTERLREKLQGYIRRRR